MTNSTYTPSVHLFVDMDGTLVTWKQAACFEELLQENYFRDLPPYKEVVDAINWLNSTYPEIDVHILSAYMPENPYSVNEKNEWLDTYLPAIPKANRIFVPCGISKAEAAANAAFAEDKANGVDHGDTEPITADDCTAFDEAPLYCIGEAEPDNYECYHNFYAVFPISVR